VWLDVRKELRHFVTIKPEGEATVVMRVKYEKIPRYCDVCGRMGHVKEECSSREHCPSKEGFGKWLLADTAWNHAQLQNAGDQVPRPPCWENRGCMGRGGLGQAGVRDASHGRDVSQDPLGNPKRKV
jgi:hypothetical protein